MAPRRACATSSWARASTLIVSSCTAPSLRNMAGTPPARACAPISPCACSVSSRTSSCVSLSSGAGAEEPATHVSVTAGTDTQGLVPILGHVSSQRDQQAEPGYAGPPPDQPPDRSAGAAEKPQPPHDEAGHHDADSDPGDRAPAVRRGRPALPGGPAGHHERVLHSCLALRRGVAGWPVTQ